MAGPYFNAVGIVQEVAAVNSPSEQVVNTLAADVKLEPIEALAHMIALRVGQFRAAIPCLKQRWECLILTRRRNLEAALNL